MATPTSEGAEPARRRVPLGLALVVMALVLVVAALILARVAGPLYGLLFPAQVPVPERAEEIEHVKPEEGRGILDLPHQPDRARGSGVLRARRRRLPVQRPQPMPDEPIRAPKA